MRNAVYGAVALFAVIAIVGAMARGGNSKHGSGSAGGTATVVVTTTGRATGATTITPSAAATAGAALPIQDGDWRLESVRVAREKSGAFEADGRVTYTGQDSGGGANAFALTIFTGGKTVAVLNASVKEVAPGETVTVQFATEDRYVRGPYAYDFQKQR